MSRSEPELTFDAFLLLSFGGPEGMDEVLPFLQNVLAGRNVPPERMQAVVEHYNHFGGVSPINEQNRRLIAALKPEIENNGPRLPIYWGNRNWHPLLTDTLKQMTDDGIKRAICFVTAAYSSYSSCRQYQENLEKARSLVGPNAPEIEKLRPFYNHPGFIEANADNLALTLAQIPEDRKRTTRVIFTAHSIPLGMADNCDYQKQLLETSALVAQAVEGAAPDYPNGWQLAFQSRSGPVSQPWLEPDILDCIKQQKVQGISDLVVVPIGFVCDHMEVVYDLDTEASQLCTTLSIKLHRVPTVGIHPKFIKMIRQLVEERSDAQSKLALGNYALSPAICPATCCPSGR